MQGKGLIKFFLVVMLVVCAIQLMYIFPTRSVEKNADNYANSLVSSMADGPAKVTNLKQARSNYLDSMSSETIFSIPLLKKYTYQELKQRQLALGLDLKGGMSVVMQVGLKDFIKSLSKDSKDPTFLAALEQADEAQKNTQDNYVSLFASAWRANSGGKKLASIFIRSEAMRENINASTSDGEVATLIREQANETVTMTYNRLKERIDKMGVVQPNISLDAARDLITVELPGIDNPERARSFLQAAAVLEFWNVYRNTEGGLLSAFGQANTRLKNLASGADAADADAQETRIDTLYTFTDDLGNIDSTKYTLDTVAVDNALAGGSGPLLSKLQLNNANLYPPSVIGVAAKNQRRTIDNYMQRDDIKKLFPQDVKFLWSKDPMKTSETVTDNDIYELYAIKKERGRDTAPLDGEYVTDADAQPNPQTGEIAISLAMDSKGAKIWGQMTQAAFSAGQKEIAIVLDDEVVSAPSVRSAIMDGRSSITGNYSIQEGKDVANILQVGKLPARPQIIQESLVGPSLGAKNISRSLTSLLVGLVLLLVFMVMYYAKGGMVSIICLILNIIFVLGSLASFGTVLTLPGIAGIILTIGMAVDANVIIYERIREELREGKSKLAAIQDGFNNSYSAIIDANVTTLLVAFILIYFGLGPIKGFAVVLAIGVVCSVFTAVLVGRMIIDWRTSKGDDMTFWTGMSQSAFANVNYDWLGKRKMAYMISGTIIGLGILSMIFRGFELGVDFKGGYSYNVQFEQGVNVDNESLRQALTAPFGGSAPVVKAVDSDNTFNVTTSYLIDNTDDDAANKVMAALHKGVNAIAGGNVALGQFKAPDGIGTHVVSSSKVGPTIADDISKSARYATIFSLLLIFLYIFIRFSKWQYSMGAVAALAHDTLIVLSLFSLLHGFLPFSLEIDQAFIAAILTVIGYSINDTVVVFDRIREFMGTYAGKTKNEIINMAINSTVSRTVITSLTTLFVVAVLFIFGGGSIRGFAFALLIGIIVGTYSSIFVATPVMADLTDELKAKEKTTKKRSFSRAADKS